MQRKKPFRVKRRPEALYHRIPWWLRRDIAEQNKRLREIYGDRESSTSQGSGGEGA